MGKVKDKLMELEEDDIIEWSDKLQCYILVKDTPDPLPFDLAEYLFELHRDMEAL